MVVLLLLLFSPGLAEIQFRDVANSAGIQFTLENHVTPERHMIETMAGGVAAFDYNNDGHSDLFVAGVYRNILYRNRGDGTF